MEGKAMDVSLLSFERLGVFADWKLPTDEELRFVAEDLKFNDIIIGVTRKKNTAWEPTYSANRIEERVAACRDAGLEPVVMPWAVRNGASIRDMCAVMRTVTNPTVAILLDAEENWYRSHGVNPEDAADLVDDYLKDRTWGCSSIGKAPSAVHPLARRAKFNVPQCYSFWKPTKDAHWSHKRSTFPGPQQDVGFKTWHDLNPDADLIMGNGCYWAARPASGQTPALGARHVMRFAFIETLALGVTSSWIWSLKWMLEKGARGDEVRAFFGVTP